MDKSFPFKSLFMTLGLFVFVALNLYQILSGHSVWLTWVALVLTLMGTCLYAYDIVVWAKSLRGK